MKRVFLSVLFLLIVGVPTAAYAISAKIYVNALDENGNLPPTAVPVATSYGGVDVPTPNRDLDIYLDLQKAVTDPSRYCSSTDQTSLPKKTCSCSSSTGPCTVIVATPIPDGDYPPLCGTGSNPACVLNVIGGFAEATVLINKNKIALSTSITTITNLGGTFRYIGSVSPATIVFETSNNFALPTGVWTTASKGGFKCKKNTTTTKYDAAACSLSSCSIQGTCTGTTPNTCTLCRSFGYTDEGYVTRLDPADPNSNLPASGVTVTMNSDVIFKGTTSTSTDATIDRAKEAIGSGNLLCPASTPACLTYTVPDTFNVEDGHFYLGSTQTENTPCEPLTVNLPNPPGQTTIAFTCAAKETKKATVTFANVLPDDLIFLPATSTTVSASDPAVLQIYLQADLPIDVQPIDPSAQLDPPITGQPTGFFVGGENNDFNVNSMGTRHAVALSTPSVNVCTLPAFDNTDPPDPKPLVFLSVAGSEFTPLVASGGPFLDPDGICVGQVFDFDIPYIVETIPCSSADPTCVACNGDRACLEDAKRKTCLANPVATLIIADVTQVFGNYSVDPAKGKKKTYTVVPECTKDSTGKVTCTVTAPVGGSQIVNCCPKGKNDCGN